MENQTSRTDKETATTNESIKEGKIQVDLWGWKDQNKQQTSLSIKFDEINKNIFAERRKTQKSISDEREIFSKPSTAAEISSKG